MISYPVSAVSLFIVLNQIWTNFYSLGFAEQPAMSFFPGSEFLDESAAMCKPLMWIQRSLILEESPTGLTAQSLVISVHVSQVAFERARMQKLHA